MTAWTLASPALSPAEVQNHISLWQLARETAKKFVKCCREFQDITTKATVRLAMDAALHAVTIAQRWTFPHLAENRDSWAMKYTPGQVLTTKSSYPTLLHLVVDVAGRYTVGRGADISECCTNALPSALFL